MNTTTKFKTRPAAKLGGLFFLVTAVAIPSFAHGATSVTPRALIASVDVNLVLTPPPPPREEVIVERERPSPDHVWIKGYWVWRDGRHSWVGGHWERPPHGRHVWVEPRWEHRHDGYVFIEGTWR